MHWRNTWKRALLTGGFALFFITGSAVSAVGRPVDPILLQPWSPLVLQSGDMSTKSNPDFSDFQAQLLRSHFNAVQSLIESEKEPTSIAEHMLAAVPTIYEVQPLTAAAPDDLFAIKPVALGLAQAPAADPQPLAAARQPAAADAKAAEPKAAPKVAASMPKKVSKAAEAAQTAKAAEPRNLVTTVTGATITPKKTVKAVASAYTASAEENGGYAGKDYFGNSLQVGSIAVDPDVIPLGSTVYVTGYSYDGLPAGGMMAKAVDIGGAIDGNRVDIFVPDSREKAKKFGLQNVTLYVVD
ncbi:3D domain-containing protein [Paenibacillus sp. GYB003]|uniref:3D domain-containing protein n=1 Tax=Paenibacillus sp. GYB003 TaxID=2994392 RepID=UPI002F96CC75